MKIKNDLISIKIGKKVYNFNNLILNEYIKKFVKSQLDKEYSNEDIKELNFVFLKFENMLSNIQEDSELYQNSFDIVLINGAEKNQVIESEQKISIEYIYKTDKSNLVLDLATNQYKNFEEYFDDRKIMAIGFSDSYVNNNKILAVLDTSNYNLYLRKDEDFSLLRKDIITTDAIFYTNNQEKVKAPIHLYPKKNEAIFEPTELISQDGSSAIKGKDESFGILYSVGLSLVNNLISEEFVIGEDIDIEESDTEIQINDIENYLSKYSIFPSKNVFCGTFLQPLKSSYKYIIFKYKVFQEVLSGTFENRIYTITDTGVYYYEAIPLFLNGKLNLKIKYERS